MFNKKLSIAIESLAYISLFSGEKPVSSKEICKELGLKLRYTESLMQKLVRSGILKGVRGASGGYFLARDRRKITLKEVYEIIKTLSKNKDTPAKNTIFGKLVNEINADIEKDFDMILEKITLEEIYTRAKKIKTSSGKVNKTDFVI